MLKAKKEKLVYLQNQMICTFCQYECTQKALMIEKEFGHWEIDIIIGNKAPRHDYLIKLTERKTRMGYIIR